MARAGAGILLPFIVAWATVVPTAATPAAQPAPPVEPDTQEQAEAADTPAHDLERIRRGLARGDSILDLSLPEGTPVFRVSIEQKLPGIEAWLGDLKYLRGGPVVGSRTHREFLDMVTPQDAVASFTNGELLQVMLTGLAGGLALRGILNSVQSGLASRTERKSCEEVRQALRDLNRDRATAGLGPVPVPQC